MHLLCEKACYPQWFCCVVTASERKALSTKPSVCVCVYFSVNSYSLVRFHPDSSRLLLFAADDEYSIHVWKLDRNACIAVLRGHYSAVTAMEFTPDGRLLYRYGWFLCSLSYRVLILLKLKF